MMASELRDLAIFGGPPAFAEKLYVGRPNIGDRELLFKLLGEALDRRWLTNGGPIVQEFERRLADFLGVKHCIAICNATIALEIAIRALNLTGEVIVPSFTFVATAHSVQWLGLKPVFCDVDPETHNIDAEQIETLITPQTSGILPVHLWGRPCAVERLAEIARRHKLALIFDAAHAFGCSHKGRMIGSFGDVEVFSFHATKFFNTFEGGAATTDDDDLAEKMRLMRNFGFAGYDEVNSVGTNGKMAEVAAAMGLSSLARLEEFVATNKLNHESYRSNLAGVPAVEVIDYNEAERNNFQYIVLQIAADHDGLTRDDLLAALWAENVIARRYFYPGCHRMEPYRSERSYQLPATEELAQ
ncbi:MAG TPA: aminotransferase class I/II-fold pyridoxal phosphate-dependent enzyme, partial [Pyrinomonadaceae bacterium]